MKIEKHKSILVTDYFLLPAFKYRKDYNTRSIHIFFLWYEFIWRFFKQ